MKFTGLLESHRLAAMLENSLDTEARKWKAPSFQGSTIKGTDISPMQYEQAVVWLEKLRSIFHFYPDTFFLAVTILNRMLASVKAQVKYLRCITVACLYLAAKTNEEREVIPLVKDLVEQSKCMCSSAEILRMERLILDKLQWDLYMATPMDFLNTFHAMVMSNSPSLFHDHLQINPSRHVALLTRQVQHCTACHQLLQFRGSTLALVIMTLELELMTADWFPVSSDLLTKAKIEHADFICCKETVESNLETLAPSNTVYLFISTSKDVRSRNTAIPACPTEGIPSNPLTVVSQKIDPPIGNTLASSIRSGLGNLIEADDEFDLGEISTMKMAKANRKNFS
uniref:Cyclin I family member 2 n=1 Tax=Leptobrachium leishanense TaxID=445787 RepID=A0A8C5QJ09_9ANUR